MDMILSLTDLARDSIWPLSLTCNTLDVHIWSNSMLPLRRRAKLMYWWLQIFSAKISGTCADTSSDPSLIWFIPASGMISETLSLTRTWLGVTVRSRAPDSLKMLSKSTNRFVPALGSLVSSCNIIGSVSTNSPSSASLRWRLSPPVLAGLFFRFRGILGCN